MLEQRFHTGDDYYDIEAAIQTGHVAYARERLRDIIQTDPNAEVWYLAALVALTRQDHIQHLEKALSLNPNHERARRALDLARQTPSTTPTPSASLLDRLKQLLQRDML